MNRLHTGEPHRIPYTPASALSAGDVVVIGDIVAFVPGDIAANQKSALDVGGANYWLAKVDAVAIATGDKVYWDDAAENITNVAGTLKAMGFAAADADAADTEVLVFHHLG